MIFLVVREILSQNLKFLFGYPKRKIRRIKYKKKFDNDLDYIDVFQRIYSENYWADDESVSGSGSSSYSTKNIKRDLPKIIEKFGIKSILDIPCGDFKWMSEIPLDSSVKYIGADIVPDIIENLNSSVHENREFVVLDARNGQLPKVDLIICRDLIFHMSFENGLKSLSNFKKSGSTLLLTSTHRLKGGISNKDIEDGDFRKIDLRKGPYNFPTPIAVIYENRLLGQPKKMLTLWRIKDLNII